MHRPSGKDSLALCSTLRRRLEFFQIVWEWAKEKLTTEEIKNKFLLRTHHWGTAVWHLAAHYGLIKILKIMWKWAKKELTTVRLKN